MPDPLARPKPSKKGKRPASEFMTVPEAARFLGVSTTWVVINAPRLGGSKMKGRGRPWIIPKANLEHEATARNERPTASDVVPDVGARAAAIYELLEAGRSQSEIVRERRDPPEFIAKMRDSWLKGYEVDRASAPPHCPACRSATANPRTAKCTKCAARSRVLTDAQITALDGAPLGEHDVVCAGCRAPTPAEGALHVCPSCAINIVVHDGCFAIVVGAEVVRVLSAAATAALRGAEPSNTPEAPRTPVSTAAVVVADPPAASKLSERVVFDTAGAINAVDDLLATFKSDMAKLERAVADGDPGAVTEIAQQQRLRGLTR